MKKELIRKFRLGVWGSAFLVVLVLGVVLWWMLNSVFVDTSILADLLNSLVEGKLSSTECTWLVFSIAFPIVVAAQVLGGIVAMMVLGDKGESKKKK